MELRPPGGAMTRVVGRSVMKLPLFWLSLRAKESLDSLRWLAGLLPKNWWASAAGAGLPLRTRRRRFSLPMGAASSRFARLLPMLERWV